MNIGYDAKRAFYNRTGLGNYSRNLVAALHVHYPEQFIQLYVPQLKGATLFEQSKQWDKVHIITNETILPASFWRSWGLKKALAKNTTQIYHGLSAELPLGEKPEGIKYVVTIHDLIYERFPDLYAAIDRRIYRRKTLSACRKADRIIAISEQTKRDLVFFYLIDAAKIEVVYQDCDPVFAIPLSPERKSAVQAKYALPGAFLLSVGTLESRKNTKIILEALLQLPAEVNLVLVGKATPYTEELKTFIAQHNLGERVQLLHQVSFEDLPALYQLSEVFIYPSIFEGFGIPVIEALKSGVPVIAATGSCLEEAGGPHSLYFDPEDSGTLAGHIRKLWKQADTRQLQVAQGLKYAQRFSAAQFALETMTVYTEVIKQNLL
ncbi:MAG: glycosyltransferase family 1 protein [Sphingobacteriales bacterium]|nr:MAG: glycosyltransferase family 1 protein [Sphingobacteriales bacterium]